MLKLLKLPNHTLSLYEKIWLGAPVAVWFSFQPFLRFGQDSTMYFELSIALIYLLVLALSGVPTIVQQLRRLVAMPAVWLVTAYVGYMGVSLLWTPNLTRGILTLGVTGILYLVFLAAVTRSSELKRLIPALVRLYIFMAVAMSVLAVVQLVAGIWLSQNVTLLCAGCVAEQFGFARPNVFAIEPQFFGSLLIAPGLLLGYRILQDARKRYELISFIIIAAALFLTLSRGAIFAWALGMLILFIASSKSWQVRIRTAGLIFGAFTLSLVLQGIAAGLNPSVQETFIGATSKVVSQLSLGIIELPTGESVPVPAANEATVKPNFDGYVAESTDVRVNRSTLAVETWLDTPGSMVAGVGIGGAGVAVHQKFADQIGAREIVQNQYIETLLEQGIIGLLLFASLVTGLLKTARDQKWLWALVAAFMFQWLFFSGYPNALHIYLVLILLYVTVRRDLLVPAKRY